MSNVLTVVAKLRSAPGKGYALSVLFAEQGRLFASRNPCPVAP